MLLLKAGLGSLALAGAPAAAAACPNPGSSPSPAAIIKQNIMENKASLLDPNDDIVWGDSNNNTWDTAVPVKFTVDGQNEYFRLVQTRPNAPVRTKAQLKKAEASVEVVQIQPPFVVESGDLFTSLISGDSFSSTTSEAAVTVFVPGKSPHSIADGHPIIDNQPSAYLRLSDGSRVLASVGATSLDTNPTDQADLAQAQATLPN